ncbi:MAG: hypothetical protein IPK76_07025 [Lewinellaceae bacterium]|nr:hypothetical protein [Lewinellaceae bacterium]
MRNRILNAPGPVYVETNEDCSHHVLGKHLDATVTDNRQSTVTLDNNYNDSYTLCNEVFEKGDAGDGACHRRQR